MQLISSLISAFGWVKNIVQNKPVKVEELTAPITPNLHPVPDVIENVQDWNETGYGQVADLTGLYLTVKQLSNYLDSFRNRLDAQTQANERALNKLNNDFLTIKSVRDLGGNSVTISGGQIDNITTSPSFYINSPLLFNDTKQNLFRLLDTGSMSSIRSTQGDSIYCVMERCSYPVHSSIGSINNITDGLKRTFWSVSSYAPSLIKNSSANYTWLTSTNRDGLSAQITLRTSRPTSFSEVFLSPVINSPLLIDQVSWTPSSVSNFLVASSFEATGGWTYTPRANIEEDVGIDESNAVNITTLASFTPQYISQSFTVSTAFANSITTTAAEAGSGYLDNHRLEVMYSVKGNGIPLTCIICWYDSLGQIISKDINESITSQVYATEIVSSYRPEAAISGSIQIGIFNEPDLTADVYIDNVKATLAQKVWAANRIISQDTSLTLPTRGEGARVSISVVQKNPSQDTNFSNALKYSIGFREFDLLYREFVPRGALISNPLISNKEIRQLWMNSEVSTSEGLQFVIYPYQDDLAYRVLVAPFTSQANSFVQSYDVTEGEVFNVYTNEEIEAGLVDSGNTNYIILDPIRVVEQVEGTDRLGRIQLANPVHFRQAKFSVIRDFIDTYGITQNYDPNSSVVHGLQESWRTLYLTGTLAGSGIPASGIASTPGHRPIEITIETGKFTAFPDTSGAPEDAVVRTVTLESLAEGTLTRQVTKSKKSYITYDQWLNTTTLQTLILLGFDVPNDMLTTRRHHRATVDPATTTISTVIKNNPNQVTRRWDFLQSWYNQLLSNDQIPLSDQIAETEYQVDEVLQVYQTKFRPIINGPGLTAFTLYVNTTLIDPSDYELDSSAGQIRFLVTKPVGTVKATYSYLTSPLTKKEETAINVNQLPTSRSYLTRNLTDYDRGLQPTLKHFQPDPTKPNYYPIIEYYVTSESELVFSREFFKYGDQPANIRIEYESLKLKPRFGVYVTRVTAPTRSPELKSVSLHFREVSVGVREL